jgi:hypothetical protein
MPLKWSEVADSDPAAFTLVTAPRRFAERGDAASGMDDAVCSLEKILELSQRHEAEGLGDAPWPPNYKKQKGEPPRVAPSRAKGTGKRTPKQPLITIAKAQHKEEALEGLERWKKKHVKAAQHLQIDDILVDAMRGRSSTWTRIRVNLRHVPEEERPQEEAPDPDYDPWAKYR